jgi:hypothetical protein
VRSSSTDRSGGPRNRTSSHGFGDRDVNRYTSPPGRGNASDLAGLSPSEPSTNICSHTAYDKASYTAVMALLPTGVSDRAIEAKTGVGRGTVRRWRLTAVPPPAVLRKEVADAWSVPDEAAYCYLLGAYLGDGTVAVRTPNSARLQVVNDRCYEAISEEILGAMHATFPGGSLRVHPSSTGESDVLCVTHPAILRAFPQHGPLRAARDPGDAVQPSQPLGLASRQRCHS